MSHLTCTCMCAYTFLPVLPVWPSTLQQHLGQQWETEVENKQGQSTQDSIINNLLYDSQYHVAVKSKQDFPASILLFFFYSQLLHFTFNIYLYTTQTVTCNMFLLKDFLPFWANSNILTLPENKMTNFRNSSNFCHLHINAIGPPLHVYPPMFILPLE